MKDFNAENSSRNEMPLYSCNICNVSYPDDYIGLNNHMFDTHQIEINASTSNERKRYVNWLKHAALNVYQIKAPEQGYSTFQARLYDKDSGDDISICVDTGSGTSFIDESLLPIQENLYGRLTTVSSITVRGITGERIVDRRMILPIYVQGSDNSLTKIEANPYVTKGIKAGVILGMDILGNSKNKISLLLHQKKMRIGSGQVPLYFTSPGSKPISFHVITSPLKGALKTANPGVKKQVRFLEEVNKPGKASVLPLKLNPFAKASETPEWRRKASPNTLNTPVPWYLNGRPNPPASKVPLHRLNSWR